MKPLVVKGKGKKKMEKMAPVKLSNVICSAGIRKRLFQWLPPLSFDTYMCSLIIHRILTLLYLNLLANKKKKKKVKRSEFFSICRVIRLDMNVLRGELEEKDPRTK